MRELTNKTLWSVNSGTLILKDGVGSQSMIPGLVTAGAFLLVLGIATILAIPVMLMQYGINPLAPEVAFLMIIVASVGGAILAYGVSTNPSKRQ
jgi:threonine/homoserine/homoserine lactone efflux protein